MEEHLHLVGHSKIQEFLEITKMQISNKIKEDFSDKLIQYLANHSKTLRHKDLVILEGRALTYLDLEDKQPAHKAYLVPKLKAGFLVLKLKVVDFLGKTISKHQANFQQ